MGYYRENISNDVPYMRGGRIPLPLRPLLRDRPDSLCAKHARLCWPDGRSQVFGPIGWSLLHNLNTRSCPRRRLRRASVKANGIRGDVMQEIITICATPLTSRQLAKRMAADSLQFPSTREV